HYAVRAEVPLLTGTIVTSVLIRSCVIAFSLGAGLLPAQPAPSFRNDIQPVLTKLGCNSGACHGSQYGKGGFKLSLLGFDAEADYEAIVKDLKGRRVDLEAAAGSLILRKPSLAIPHGGGRRFAVNSPTYNMLLSWISSGVAPPLAADPMLVSVDVAPASQTLAVGQRIVIRATARYNDGSARDVTALARLEVLNDSVAEIAAGASVTAKAGGRAAVLARYMGRSAVANLLVPYATSSPLTDFQPNNYVDGLVAAKWKQLGLQPAGLSSDTQFLRRVSLDLTGVLPKEEEIRAFAADTSARKRARVIDRLLERPEYADFWTLRWGDLLRVTRNGMGEKAMWNFHRWLNRSMRQNRPVDEMVREILLSRGQPNSQDVAAFYRMTRSPEEAAEAVSIAFMGLRLGCAKCHQHPFEKWSQADYYGLAAFFARIDSKPDSDYGGTTLRLKPTGFVRHPKTQQVVRPSIPDGGNFPYEGDPRRELAAWLTAKSNPWLARNFVNRYWGYMMGRGLIEPMDDIRDTNPASIPEVLQALERDFREHGFDQKHILRTIANSRVYQLDSVAGAQSPRDNMFYTYYTPKRLSAEQLLDALTVATNVPEKYPGLPPGIRPIQLPDPEVTSEFLDTFGRPRRLVPCECSRNNESNVTQALHLMNSDFVQGKIAAPGGRVANLFALLPLDQAVVNLYYATVSRPPSESEAAAAIALIRQRPEGESRRKVLEDLLWTLLNSREFLFNH
ncbi:MAG TPA: DUF1549 domain-containing protein, partial [Bryobacteraceae bacterium]|nr:DUF1549 domain-containing protein [Bryobacteraceae bacterium]